MGNAMTARRVYNDGAVMDEEAWSQSGQPDQASQVRVVATVRPSGPSRIRQVGASESAVCRAAFVSGSAGPEMRQEGSLDLGRLCNKGRQAGSSKPDRREMSWAHNGVETSPRSGPRAELRWP